MKQSARKGIVAPHVSIGGTTTSIRGYAFVLNAVLAPHKETGGANITKK